jgi:hypothetical protein
MFVFFGLPGSSNQRSLKLCEESIVGAFGVEALLPCFPAENVDVLSIEAGGEQRINDRPSLVCILHSADDAIGWVGNEIGALWGVRFHDSSARLRRP